MNLKFLKTPLHKFFIIFLIQILIPINTQDELSSSSKKISTTNILLPICENSHCSQVYTSVSVYDGCYEWKAENENYISIIKEKKKGDSNKCFSKCLITTKNPNEKIITHLIAHDIISNDYFKVKIGFAQVNKISIEKNFNKIYCGEKSELHVLAHDKYGNIFSSLEGWKFKWIIISGENFAELIKISKDGQKKISDIRKNIERNYDSDSIIIRGIQPGIITVRVEILEDDFYGKIYSEIKIYVVEPFNIIPQDPVYLMPKSNFNFDLIYSLQKRKIPSNERKYFKWEVTNKTCGEIDKYGKFTSSNIVCNTKVIVRDTRLNQYNTDEGFVYVELPNNINIGYALISNEEKKDFDNKYIVNVPSEKFNFSPLFKLVEGKNYLIKNVLMHNNKIIYVNKKEFKFDLNIDNIKPYLESKPNCLSSNEICSIKPKKKSNEETIHTSTLFKIKEKQYNPKAIKTVIIYPKIMIEKFNMEYFTLPFLGYDNNGNIKSQELYLIVSGGSGNYLYKTSNYEIIDIVDNTYLKGKKIGNSTIKVIDREIEENEDEINIYVNEIGSYTYFEERQEVMINEEFFITPVAIQNKESNLMNKYDKRNIFTNCTNLISKYELSNENIKKEYIKQSQYKNQYYAVRDFINNNLNILKAKMNFLKSNDIEKAYFNYSNYGICDSNLFSGVKEGEVKIQCKSELSLPSPTGNMNNQFISSMNTAKVFVFIPMTIENTIYDNFTDLLIKKSNIIHPDIEKIYIISQYSGIKLKLNGGVYPWPEYPKNEFIEEKYIIENNKVYSIDNIGKKMLLETNHNKELYAYCRNKDNEFTFTVEYHNKQDESLLKPKRSKCSFTIGCYNPSALSIYLIGQSKNFLRTGINNYIFGIYQKNGIEYFVNKNSTEVLRVYAFDSHKRIFSNITTLKGYWNKDSNNFGIIPENKYDKYNNNDITKGSNEFIQDLIHFKQLISSFDIKYFIRDESKSHYARINVIDLPEIYPSNATIYVRRESDFELQIIHGSGDFDIYLNDNSIASFTYDSTKRIIYLRPIKEGIVFVNVHDKYLSNKQHIVTSIIYIMDIKRILIHGSELLKQNSSSFINIEIYDTNDNIFPEEQLKTISLELGNNTYTGIFQKLNEEHLNISLYGIQPGNYPLSIKETLGKITSNILTITVFKGLEIFPPYLLMVPGSSYTLSVKGGPDNKENIIITYEMNNSKIANVTRDYPEVYAKEIGKTKLKISVIYKYDHNKIFTVKDDIHIINKSEILCIEEVNVTVDFPEKVEIIEGGRNRKIYTNSTIRLLAAFKKGNEVFTYSIGDFNYKWEVDNVLLAKTKYYTRRDPLTAYDTCEIDNRYSNKYNDDSYNNDCSNTIIPVDEDPNPKNSVGVFLYSFKEGILTISLTVNIEYKPPYKNHKPNLFSTSEKIIISDQIYVNIPEFYGNPLRKTSIYMIPRDIDHDLHTNKDIQQKYSIVNQFDNSDASSPRNNIVSLTNEGRITSYNNTGLVYIRINQIDNNENINNNVPVILPILINDFYSIFIEKTHSILDMEVDQDLVLKIIIQHEYGILFADRYRRLQLRVVVSHEKYLKVELTEDSSSIVLHANRIGTSNVILFNPITRKIYDVFKVNISSAATKLDKIYLNLGGTINFLEKQQEKKNQLTKNGKWYSDNQAVVKIDNNGKAIGVSEGSATISLKNDEGKIILSTKVEVRKIKQIIMDRSSIPSSLTDIKNNANYKSQYNVPILLYSSNSESFTKNENDAWNEINQNINFKCISKNSDYIYAESNKNNECIIIIRDSKYKSSNYDKPTDIKINLIAESNAYEKKNRYTVESEEILPFSSSFKIKNDIHNIKFSFSNREYKLYLDNLNDLDIRVSDEKKVKIEEINKEKKYIQLIIPDSIVDEFTNNKLYITNILSGQKEEINMSFINDQGGKIFFGLISQQTFTDCLTMILLIVTIIILVFYVTNSQESGNMAIRNNENKYFNNVPFQNNYQNNIGNNFGNTFGRPSYYPNNYGNTSSPRFPRGSRYNEPNLNMEKNY